MAQININKNFINIDNTYIDKSCHYTINSNILNNDCTNLNNEYNKINILDHIDIIKNTKIVNNKYIKIKNKLL